jgi:ferritin-like metal-binding protein YciE
MAKMKSLEDLFINLLKDMYYAEKQILKALPKTAKQADSTELRRFEHHLKETEGQVQHLEQVFALCRSLWNAHRLGQPARHERGRNAFEPDPRAGV